MTETVIYACEKDRLAAEAKAAADIKAAQEALAAAIKAQIDARNAATTAAEQENDTTKLTMVPLTASSDVKVECLGMYFNRQAGFTSDDVPAKELTIEKDVLDRSTKEIIFQFDASIKDRSKIVYQVDIDGVKVDGYGTNLPYILSSGKYVTTGFQYPNSAKASADGTHTIHVKTGLITGIVEKQLGLVVWDTVKGITETDFRITLLPHKIVD